MKRPDYLMTNHVAARVKAQAIIVSQLVRATNDHLHAVGEAVDRLSKNPETREIAVRLMTTFDSIQEHYRPLKESVEGFMHLIEGE